MTEPLSWRVLQMLAGRLAAISVAGGYFTDVGADITSEPAQLEEGAQTISIAATGINQSGSGSSGISPRSRAMTFVIEATIPATFTTAQQRSHELLADIERALLVQISPDAQIAEIQLVRDVTLTGRTITRRTDGIDATVVQVTGTATYLQSQ